MNVLLERVGRAFGTVGVVVGRGIWLITCVFVVLPTHFFEVMWLEYEPECEKRLPQFVHSNGFSPL